jgi:hypothetical protein
MSGKRAREVRRKKALERQKNKPWTETEVREFVLRVIKEVLKEIK